MNYYIEFSKQGYIRYTSHLDLMRIFERAFKRARLPLQYSQGYHPHPKMVFAQPLSLGYSSLAEILEFEFKEEVSDHDLRDRLQAMLPEGLKIAYVGRTGPGKTFASRLESTTYLIELPAYMTPSKEDLDAFFSQERIMAEKKHKKRKGRGRRVQEMRQVDIKAMILNYEYIALGIETENTCLRVNLLSNNEGSLNPSLLMKALAGFLGKEYLAEDFEYEREKMLFRD